MELISTTSINSIQLQSSKSMMFTFIAALFAIASGAAGDSATSSVSQSLAPSEAHAGALLKKLFARWL